MPFGARSAGLAGRVLSISLGILIALGLLVHLRSPAAIPSRAPGGTVRVVTYNIRAGLGGLEGVAGELQELAPDLVALQEVERGVPRSRSVDQPSFLGEALGFEAEFAGSIPLNPGEHGVAVLSRWPISETEILELPQATGRWPRVALLTRVETPVGPIRFVSIHLARPWSWPLSNTRTRLEQIAALRRRLASEVLPVIVAGDFNAMPMSPEEWTITRDLQQSWSPWRDGWGTTFPLSVIGLAGHVKIDHVFHDEHWKAHGTWVAPDGASDHRALVADLARR